MDREPPLVGQVLMITPDAELDCDYHQADEDGTPRVAPVVTTDLDQATTITSQVAGSEVMHKVVLDIDLPVRVYPSSTPGHYHLYIDTPVTWPDYRNLLDALAQAGIIEPGYANASKDRGYTRLRLPWIRKQLVPVGDAAPLLAPEQARLGVLDGAL